MHGYLSYYLDMVCWDIPSVQDIQTFTEKGEHQHGVSGSLRTEIRKDDPSRRLAAHPIESFRSFITKFGSLFYFLISARNLRRIGELSNLGRPLRPSKHFVILQEWDVDQNRGTLTINFICLNHLCG